MISGMNLIVETRPSGSEYYIVEVDAFHDHRDPWYYTSFKEIDKWCVQTFGAQDFWGVDPKTGWKRMRNRYFFGTQSKRDWFVLRWS